MLDFSGLNEDQLKAVTWKGAPLLLLAGPGSGKTFTIVNRILYLLECGVSPQNILVITFTKDAAVSMRKRFLESCNKEYPVNFGTFHSVFYHMLQKSLGIPKCKILTVAQKKQIVIRLSGEFRNIVEQENIELNDFSEKMISAISCYKNTQDKFLSCKNLQEECKTIFEQLFEKYQTYLSINSFLDFDDMLFRCKIMLEENPDIRSFWSAQFSHILIDEFQDTNPIQYEIIKLISNRKNIFVVGDDDQSIYGFRGAKPNILKEFQRDFNADIFLLRTNYRCNAEIIEKSLNVIGENKKRFSKDLCACISSQNDSVWNAVSLNDFKSKQEEISYILKELNQYIEKKKAFSCGILFRTNRQIQFYASELEKQQISFSMKEKSKSIYEHFIIKDIMSYLRVANQIANSEDYYRIINTPDRGISREAIRNGFTKENIKSWYENAYLTSPQKQKIFRQIDLLFKQLESIGKMSLSLSVQYILKAINYEGYLLRKAVRDDSRLNEWMDIIELLKRDTIKFPSIKELIKFQEEYNEKMEHCKKNPEGQNKEGIQLMTVHASKGLEFDFVFIPDCNERIFPYGSMPEEDVLEEERRLFYVAMTRARKKLYMMYVIEEGSTRKQMSRFLLPIKNDYGQNP